MGRIHDLKQTAAFAKCYFPCLREELAGEFSFAFLGVDSTKQSIYASLVPTLFVRVHQDAWHLYDFIVYDEIIPHVLDICIKESLVRGSWKSNSFQLPLQSAYECSKQPLLLVTTDVGASSLGSNLLWIPRQASSVI